MLTNRGMRPTLQLPSRIQSPPELLENLKIPKKNQKDAKITPSERGSSEARRIVFQKDLSFWNKKVTD